ncbi:MAG: hypothetical protein WBP93_04195, partial [Pyrinomonadaceae bacterium]
RPRTVTQQQQQTAPPAAPTASPATQRAPSTQTPAQTQEVPNQTVTPVMITAPTAFPVVPLQPLTKLPANKVRAKIAEAQRIFKTRPVQTALTSTALDVVTLAALDTETNKVHLLTLSKEIFLTKGAALTLTTSLGSLVQLRILRANGVNTAVTIFDSAGRSLVPLTVEYPIERGGVFREMAYYTSGHPALLSADIVKAGQSYVYTMVDAAARRLKEKGVMIAPNIVEVAKRLCIVEHVDHERFKQENRIALYEEIYSLYALNELDTYRYSVSIAGAGGMVQMINWAYQTERTRHPGVGLNPDFVLGMRNHGNALEAMLLYMQDTWNDLAGSDDVQYALNAKLATQTELLAAGYNSNAAKLPLYIRRGGASWRTLIPRETQMYLQIYKSLDSLIPGK